MTKRELMAKGRSATLDDLKALDPSVTCLTPEPVAAIMGGSAQWLRIKARESPQDLGFGVCVLNSRIYIPVNGLIKFLDGAGRTRSESNT